MLQPWHWPLLFGTGLVAGFVDSIAGGGGLITLPVLLSLGLEPKDALGTNKLQASFGSGCGAWQLRRPATRPVHSRTRHPSASYGSGCLHFAPTAARHRRLAPTDEAQ